MICHLAAASNVVYPEVIFGTTGGTLEQTCDARSSSCNRNRPTAWRISGTCNGGTVQERVQRRNLIWIPNMMVWKMYRGGSEFEVLQWEVFHKPKLVSIVATVGYAENSQNMV